MREAPGMHDKHHADRPAERGSAMIIAILVMVILTLLGVSFLLMAETENRIAENERLSSQALYTAESAARQVKRWFDRPPFHPGFVGMNLSVPPIAAIDRTLRIIDDDGDPSTAAFPQDGSAGAPRYKQGFDRDADGVDDLLDRPYRGSLIHALLGTEDGPDMRISETTTAGKNYLTTMSNTMLAGFPGGGGLQARITEIDIYAPPYIDLNGNWTRYGMATVKITARIYQMVGGNERVLAERMVKAVINEMPYPGPFGPLHSCANMSFNGDFTVHWGAGSAVEDADLTNNHAKVHASLPRVVPPGHKLDMLWGYDAGAGSDADFLAYLEMIEGEDVDDPWFRYLSGGDIADAPNTDVQPWDFDWTPGPGPSPGWNPLLDGHWPTHSNGPDDGSHSNVFQRMPLVGCPEFEYEVWKTIATSGTSDVHYFVWDNGTSFKENGLGAAQTFQSITDNREGLFFFDTTDGIAPYDDDADGVFDNLTPAIDISGGTWGTRGFVYLNSLSFQTQGVTGRNANFRAPGEPWLDIDQNNEFDPGEPWVNLVYPTTLGDPFVADSTEGTQDDGSNGAPVRNTRGTETIVDDAVVWGILFNNGEFEATGNATYYGSVVAKSGVAENSPAAGTPDFYWDQSIAEDWPPPGWDLPRVVITRWETDL